MPGSTWFLWENVAHKYSLVILFTLPGILITPGLGTDELYLLSLTTYRRQAVYIFLNRGIDPLEAIRASSKITYGKKWAIFWEASCWVSLCMLAALFSLLFLAGHAGLGCHHGIFRVCCVYFGLSRAGGSYLRNLEPGIGGRLIPYGPCRSNPARSNGL